MNMPAGDGGELARLERYLESLESARAEFEHQARRYGDARERAGGVLGSIEPQVRQLYRNLADNEKERDRVRSAIARLRSA